MKNLIKFFVERNLIVNIITLAVLIFGFYSVSKINKEGYPTVDRKIMYITTIYPGASPEEVEINVTIPMEESIQSVDGIKEYTSVSRENYSMVTVYIDRDYPDAQKVKDEVRRAVDNVDLPEDVTKAPSIFEWKVSAFPVIEIGMFSDTMEYTELRTRAKDLEKQLRELDSVSGVNEKGILDREIKIKLDLDKLNYYYVSIEEVINAIDVNNFELTGGVYEDDNVDKIITVSSKLSDAEDIGNIILRSTFEGYRIYLKDVAEIEEGFEDQSTLIRLNGESGVALQVAKKENSDIIKTVDEIKSTVDEYMASVEETDLEIAYLWDLSHQTRVRLKIVTDNALIGLVLVLLILLIFMDLRNAFWTAAGIPFSIAFAMIFIRLAGVTINSISLLGVIVVLGMVVDDAIIIAENIYRHRLMGKPWKTAATEATMQMAFPVLSTILTTVVAFLSLYNLGGNMGDFSKEIPLVVIFVLAGSLFESLLILPNHVSHFVSKKRENITLKEKKFVITLRNGYQKLLKQVLRFRWAIIPVFTVAFFWALYAMFSGNVLKFVAFPSDEATAIYVDGEVKDGQTLDYTSEKVLHIENTLSNYTTNVIESFSAEMGDIGYPEVFAIDIHLTPAIERDISAASILSNLRQAISNANAFTNMTYKIETGGPNSGRDVRIEVTGNDNEIRREITDLLADYLNTIEGTYDLTRSDEENKIELKLDIDYEKAAMLGVSPISIAYTIRAAFNGVIASDLQTPEELVEFRVRLEDEYINDISTLYKLRVLNNMQKLIPVYTLVDMQEQSMVSKIDHYNGDRNTIIECDVDETLVTPMEILAMLNEDFATFEEDYPGFQLTVGGEAEDSQETIDSMIEAAIMAFSAIFFILIIQFKSISQAGLVILAVPFSFVGIVIVLLTHNMPLSSMALFGGIGLIGVVVNDSLVMVDYLNSMRKEMNRKNVIDVIVAGASTRLRPVLLTTLTTVAGLLPTAYGIGGRDPFIIPTTLTMSWGLVFATMLTLLLIPSLYLVEYLTRWRIKKIGQWIRAKKAGRLPAKEPK